MTCAVWRSRARYGGVLQDVGINRSELITCAEVKQSLQCCSAQQSFKSHAVFAAAVLGRYQCENDERERRGLSPMTHTCVGFRYHDVLSRPFKENLKGKVNAT
jgi:hypothetical protein